MSSITTQDVGLRISEIRNGTGSVAVFRARKATIQSHDNEGSQQLAGACLHEQPCVCDHNSSGTFV